MDLIDNSTIIGNTIHLAFEVIFWHYIFKFIKYYIKKEYSKTASYQRTISTQITEEELLVYICALVQHSSTVISVLYGFYFNAPFFIREGVLMEAAFDINDSVTHILNKFVRKTSDLPNVVFISLIFHHSSILALIPVNMYTHHIGIQHTIISLSIWTPAFAVLMIFCHTLDVYDLKQRGQFTVLYFTQILIFAYFRFYNTPYYFYKAVSDHYAELDKYSQIMIPLGIILNTLFNVLWFKIRVRRFYDFIFSDKYVHQN